MGEYSPVGRADAEDRLVDSLEEALRSGRLLPFREAMQWWSRAIGLDEDTYRLIMHNDTAAWIAVWTYTCALRRMLPRWEHAANRLLAAGCPTHLIPPGTMELGR